MNTAHCLTLELSCVELLNGGLEIFLRLVLDKSSSISLAANLRIHNIQSGLASEILKILPASLYWETGDAHAVWGTARTGGNTLVRDKSLVAAGATGELDDETLSHEIGTI